VNEIGCQKAVTAELMHKGMMLIITGIELNCIDAQCGALN
jgi:hypothetical protein